MTVARSEDASRRYRSSLREEQARRTRDAVITAAGRRFVEAGFQATTMRDVAAEAGVSVETVYAQGSKASLLLAAVDRTLAGDDEPVALRDRPDFRALIEADDPRVALEHFRVALVEGLAPMVPLLGAFSRAAAVDAAVREAFVEYERRRHEDMSVVFDVLHRARRNGLSREQSVDIVWTLLDLALVDKLVQLRGWTAEQYADWVVDALARLIL